MLKILSGILCFYFLAIAGAYAKDCQYVPWDFAYAHVENNPGLLFGEDFRSAEPDDLAGPTSITCPDLEKFKGKYISDNIECKKISIKVKNKLTLDIEGSRDFVGINTGNYLPMIKGLILNEISTSQVGEKIEEVWTSNGIQIALYKIELINNKNLIMTLQSPKKNMTCAYTKN